MVIVDITSTIPVIVIFFLFLASVFDIIEREVPDTYTIGTGVIALIIYGLNGNWLAPFLGGMFCFFVGYWVFQIEGWGGADAKMFASMGVVIGLNFSNLDLAWYLFILFIIGVFWYVFYWHGLMERKRGVPLLPVFLISYLVYLI